MTTITSIAAAVQTTSVSRKLIAEWTRTEQVGTWDDCAATIRLYADRALYKGQTVRWENNSGRLASDHRRITGRVHAQLLALAMRQTEDEADYSDEAFELVYFA